MFERYSGRLGCILLNIKAIILMLAVVIMSGCNPAKPDNSPNLGQHPVTVKVVSDFVSYWEQQKVNELCSIVTEDVYADICHTEMIGRNQFREHIQWRFGKYRYRLVELIWVEFWTYQGISVEAVEVVVHWTVDDRDVTHQWTFMVDTEEEKVFRVTQNY